MPHAIGQDQGSNGYTVMNYCRPRWGDRVGYGESMWHWDIPRMQGLLRQARKSAGADVSQADFFDRYAARLAKQASDVR